VSGAVLHQTSLTGISHVFRIAFSPDGRLLAIAGRQAESDTNGPSVKILEVTTLKLLAAPPGHTDMVLATVFSPDGKTLATSSADDSVRFWDTGNWNEIPPSLGHKEYVSSIAFSPDGKSIASAGFEGALKLWSPATRRELVSLQLGGYGFHIEFSPDGRTLVGWSGAGLRVWRAPLAELSLP
jgi:WD40 repeat protein